MQNTAIDPFYQELDLTGAWPEAEPATTNNGFSLPAILLNAALSIATVAGTYYLARFGLDGTRLTSGAIAGLMLLATFTPLGLLCARLTGAPVAVTTLGWGCGLTGLMLLFFGICGVSGALAAVVVQVAGLAGR